MKRVAEEWEIWDEEKEVAVRVARSRLSSFLIFFLLSILSLKLLFFPLFLAPRVRVSDDMGHIAQRKC